MTAAQRMKLTREQRNEYDAQVEHERVLKMIPKKSEALARLLKKAQRVQYNTSTKTLTAFFNDRGGFMCRGEVAERVRALIACEEVEG